MSELKPTIGRIVHYKDAEDRILPAIVVAVNEEGACCLQVFGMDKVYPAHVVDQGEGQGQWDWMPFQKDQQARVGYAEVEAAQSGTPKQTLEVDPIIEEEVIVTEPETVIIGEGTTEATTQSDETLSTTPEEAPQQEAPKTGIIGKILG